jgi:NAD(P)-dependent dehydrogenase (short-subunit alcohol dehydrogenase family)
MKTIFITGSSSGIGKATARLFQEKGWNVVATMRRPEKESELTKLERVLVTRLDVTEPESIRAAVKQGADRSAAEGFFVGWGMLSWVRHEAAYSPSLPPQRRRLERPARAARLDHAAG